MPSTNAQKLGINAGCRVTIRGLDLNQVRLVLGPLPEKVIFDDEGTADIAMLFADSLADVEATVTELPAHVAPAGRLWVAYRKGATRQAVAASTLPPPLHRDSLQQLLTSRQLTGVTLISLNDIWSAMRIKPA